MKRFFRRFGGIFRESIHLIRKEKAYFLAPIILLVILLSFFIYHVGPSIVVTFIYAGV